MLGVSKEVAQVARLQVGAERGEALKLKLWIIF
jgi:hypothetical protein